MVATRPKIPDLPDVSLEPSQLLPFLVAVKEILQTHEGLRGSELDKWLTRRDLVDVELLRQRNDGAFEATAPAGVKGDKGDTGASGTPYVPDYTAPPSPATLTAVSLFRGALIKWDAPTYTTGHGNAYTELFVAQYGGSGALPTFASALPVGKAGGATSIYVHDAAVGAQLHIWATHVSADGIASATPTGGLNGVQITIGQVGNSDLADLIIEARNLAAQIGGGNLVINSSFEGDANGDGLSDDWTWGVGGGGDGGRVHVFSRPEPAPGIGGQFSQKLQIVSATNANDSLLLNALPFAAAPATKYVASGYLYSNSAGAYMLVREYDAGAAAVADHVVPIPSAFQWHRLSAKITTHPACASVQVMFRGIDDPGEYIQVDGVQVENGDVMTAFAERPNDLVAGVVKAKHLAANSIAVGTAAIQNGAIVNAMIANLAVDNAKIADLGVAKLIAGYLQIGAYIRSTNYLPGASGFELGSDGVLRAVAAVLSGTVTANAGAIGGNTINAFGLQSPGYSPGVSGWTIRNDGTVEFGAASIRGQLTTAQIQVGAATSREVETNDAGFGEPWQAAAQTMVSSAAIFKDLTSVGRNMWAFADLRVRLRHRGTHVAGIRVTTTIDVLRTDTMAAVLTAAIPETRALGFNGVASNGMGAEFTVSLNRAFQGVNGITYRIRVTQVLVESFDSTGAPTVPGGSSLSPPQRLIEIGGMVALREDKL